jgi:hypothetical protein
MAYSIGHTIALDHTKNLDGDLRSDASEYVSFE